MKDGGAGETSRTLTRRELLTYSSELSLLFLLGACSAPVTPYQGEQLITPEQKRERLIGMGMGSFADFYSESERFSQIMPGWKMWKFPGLLTELDQVAKGEISSRDDPRLRATSEARWGNRISEVERDAFEHVRGLRLWTDGGFKSAQSLPSIQNWLNERAEYVPKLVLACPGMVGINPNRHGGAWFSPRGRKSDSGFVFNNFDNQGEAVVGWLHESIHAYEQYYLELSPYYSREDAGRYMAARVRTITDSLAALAKADGEQAKIFKEGRPLIPSDNIPKIFRETAGFVESIMEKSSVWLDTPVSNEGSLHEKYNFLTQALVSHWIKNKETVPVGMLSSDWLGTYVRAVIWSAISEIDHYHTGPIQNKEGGLISGSDRVSMPDSDLAGISIELEKVRRETVWGISGADRWEQVRRDLGIINPAECIIGDPGSFCVNVEGIDPPTGDDLKFLGGFAGAFIALLGAGLYVSDSDFRRRINQALFGKSN